MEPPVSPFLPGEVEIDHPVGAALAGAIETHARVRAGNAEIAHLASCATALVAHLAHELGLEPAAGTGDRTDAAGVLRVIEALRDALGARLDRLGLRTFFDEITGHGRYLAGKASLDYAGFLETGGALSERMVEADAILNVCSVLVEALKRRFEGDDPGLWGPEADGPRGGIASLPLPPWAAAQLRELARIEPRLGVQLENQARAFKLSRPQPLAHPLYRCLVENELVLNSPPLAIVSLAGREPAAVFPSVAALIGAAQNALGLENVLITVSRGLEGEEAAVLGRGARTFDMARQAEALSWDQKGRFLLDYVSNIQPFVVVNCGCPLMWQIYRNVGKPLSRIARLHALMSRLDTGEDGALAGFSASHLADCLPWLTGAYVDEPRFKAAVTEAFGFTGRLAERIRVLQPSRADSGRKAFEERVRELDLFHVE